MDLLKRIIATHNDVDPGNIRLLCAGKQVKSTAQLTEIFSSTTNAMGMFYKISSRKAITSAKQSPLSAFQTFFKNLFKTSKPKNTKKTKEPPSIEGPGAK